MYLTFKISHCYRPFFILPKHIHVELPSVSEYTRRLKLLEGERQRFEDIRELLEDNKCSCTHRNCACCEHMKIRKLHLDDNVCINITYISEDIGIRFSMSVDNHVYYSKEVSSKLFTLDIVENVCFSVRNPPPICYDVPHLREYASICIEFYNVSFVYRIYRTVKLAVFS